MREWLRYAEEDLVLARGGLGQPQLFRPRQVCFSAQQAAEKAIKAGCIAADVGFPFIHDLAKLAGLLPPSQIVTADIGDLARLSDWATATRYPGEDEPDWAEAERSVKTAETVVADVRASLDDS